MTLAAAAVLASCKDGGGGPGDADVEPLLDDEAKIFELQLNSCATVQRCFAPLRASLAKVTSGLDNQDLRHERCLALAPETFEQGQFAALLSSVAAGRVVYHSERLAACVKADAARDCHELSKTLEPCLQAFAGTVELGERCATQFDCGAGAYCDIGLTPDASCPSVCKARLPAGSVCTQPAECENGTRCFDPELVPPATPNLRCLPPSGEGEGCHGPHCATGLVCAAASASDRSCQPLTRAQQPGDSCTPTSQCAGDAACRTEDASAEPTCSLETEGASCSKSTDCAATEYCGCTDIGCSAKRCTPWPREGEPCGSVRPGVVQVCEQGLFCAGDACRARRKNGERCDNNGMCWSLHCEDGECAAPGDCG